MVYICNVCGFVYDEKEGCTEKGIAPNTKWQDVSDDFECPLCSAKKDEFTKE